MLHCLYLKRKLIFNRESHPSYDYKAQLITIHTHTHARYALSLSLSSWRERNVRTGARFVFAQVFCSPVVVRFVWLIG